jgi:hypothetical protein
MVAVQVWKGLDQAVFDVDPAVNLVQLRTMVNNAGKTLKLTNADQFLYYNEMEDSESILPVSREAALTVSKLIKQGNIKLVDTGSARPDLIGIITPWLYNRVLGVQVLLNNETNAQVKNGNRFQPMMMTNVRSANPNKSSNFNQVVICEEGSQVMFRISSWCPAGFGYRIKPGRGREIVNGLYIVADQNNHSGRMQTDLQRYQTAEQMIDVSACATLGIPAFDSDGQGQWGFYQQITVQSWRVMEYERAGSGRYSSDAEAPASAYDPAVPPDFTQGRRGGVVSGQDISAATASPGQASGQKFGRITMHRQDNPDQNQVLGEVIFYLFVFKDRAAAEKIILGVNAPDGTPYQ